MTKRKFTGKDLIAAGYEPGPYFGSLLEEINSTGWDQEVIDKHLPVPVETIPLQEPTNFNTSYYLPEAQSSAELANNQAVIETMYNLVKTPTVVEAFVMPDACPAGSIPVGGVAVAENAIHPGWHSADICCSMMMTEFENVSPKALLDDVHSRTHFGGGGRDQHEMSSYLYRMFKENPYLHYLTDLGDHHMGTQGDGNHFSFVGTNMRGNTCLVTHHGSRGPGAKLFKHGMGIAEKFRAKHSPETAKGNAWIPADSQDGQDYWAALHFIEKWTKENHGVIHSTPWFDRVVSRTFNSHNFVYYMGGNLYAHAKGATPMFTGIGPRLIPMNMGSPILVVEADESLWAPHGAGRNMSRTAFKRLGIDDDMSHLDIRWWTGNPDVSEKPSAYKSAAQVRAEIDRHNLATIVDEIQPYGCIMAGEWRR